MCKKTYFCAITINRQKMKNIKLIFAIVTVLFFFSGCEMFKPDNYIRAVGTYYASDKEEFEFYIEIDGGSTIVSDDFDFELETQNDSARVLFYYSEIGKYKESEEELTLCKVRDLEKVIVKPVSFVNSETSDLERDSIGYDPVDILNAWILGDYLNVEFNYYGSGYNHYFSLVFDEEHPVSTMDELYMQLLHQDRNDQPLGVYWDIISFDISALQVYQADSFIIRLEGYGYNDYSYSNSFMYRYSDN